MPEHAQRCCLLAIDAEGYSGNAGTHMPSLNAAIVETLGEAFRRSGLTDAWKDPHYAADEGDGYVIVLDEDQLPRLIDPLIETLQDVLAEWEPRIRGLGRDVRLRMRLALHAGRARPDESGRLRLGEPMNEVHRLVDADPVRHALKDSGQDVTFLAAVVSDRVYEEWIVPGDTGLRPEQFRRIQAQVKAYDQPAWMYVPKDSQRDRERGRGTPDAPDPASPAPQGNNVTFGNNTGQVFWGSTVHGAIHHRGDDIRGGSA